MTLNKQLLCVSLILLSLPWAGCQYLREMDSIMRSGQERALMATTRAIATVYSQRTDLLYPHGEIYSVSDNIPAPLYFHPLSSEIWIDGYDDGWKNVPAIDYQPPNQISQRVRYRTAIYSNNLFFFFEVFDDQVIYNNPSLSLLEHGDRLVLATGNGQSYNFSTSAPGEITVKYSSDDNSVTREPKISAYWQDTEQGFNLEISMPLQLAQGRVGFTIVDDDSGDRNQSTTISYGQQFSNLEKRRPRYSFQPQALRNSLAHFEQEGQRITIVDPNFWSLGTQGNFDKREKLVGHWLIRKLYRSLLSSKSRDYPDYRQSSNTSDRLEVTSAMMGETSSRWYKDSERSNHYIVATAVPIYSEIDGVDSVVAVVVTEQSSEQLAALADSAFNRLLLLSFGAISFVALGLLGYASLLSWRIRGLSRAAREVIGDDGKLLDNFPYSPAKDEIGDLSRNYSQLLDRLRDYTEYLQTLSRKLSHELRTPLAIIHSSLDNLKNESLNEKSSIYQQRAKEGAMRLGAILTALSEATRVEESIAHAEPENVDMVFLLVSLSQAYQDIYHDHNIVFDNLLPDTFKSHISAAPDLLVQMLDKLIDNAVGFCPLGGNIEIVLSETKGEISLSVANEGPLLPEKMRGQLFDNMVSVREKNNNDTHLGLGLHIVKLIVTFHEGHIRADNRSDNSGVIFTITLPQRLGNIKTPT